MLHSLGLHLCSQCELRGVLASGPQPRLSGRRLVCLEPRESLDRTPRVLARRKRARAAGCFQRGLASPHAPKPNVDTGLRLPRCGASCTLLIVAAASGRLTALLVAAEAAPRWADAAPQCIVAADGGNGITATRCEARVQPAHEDAAVMMVDVVDLQVPCNAPFMIRPNNCTDQFYSHASKTAVQSTACSGLRRRLLIA